MREVILSTEGDSALYLVPDAAAKNLESYCLKFCMDWLHHSPEAAKYRIPGGVCYTAADFIEYLNRYVFPREPSKRLKYLGWIDPEGNLPETYRQDPYFNF